MYQHSKQSELLRFARVDAGSTVIDVFPGDGYWTGLFSDIVGPEGRIYGFVPAEVAHLGNDPVGRIRALAGEPGRENVRAISADLVALPESSPPRMSCGCTCSITISMPRFSRPGAQPRPTSIEPFISGSSLAGFTSSSTTSPPPGRAQATPGRCIGSNPPSFAKRWQRRASCWTPKAACWQTETIDIPSRCSTRRSRARPIASPIGS